MDLDDAVDKFVGWPIVSIRSKRTQNAPPSAAVRWDNLPAFSDGYPKASDAIRTRVHTLLTEFPTATIRK